LRTFVTFFPVLVSCTKKNLATLFTSVSEEPVGNLVEEIPEIFNYVRNKFPRVPNNTFNLSAHCKNWAGTDFLNIFAKKIGEKFGIFDSKQS
jgi:hypothetical protein